MSVTTSNPGLEQAATEGAVQPAEVRMMLIAGGDLYLMEETAVEVYRAGHIPVLCEWFSSPLTSIGGPPQDPSAELSDVVHPIAERLLARCDAVLRVDGLAAGADLMVALARQRGIRVFQDLQEALAG
ncbi:MAG TPA: hypothetical protein VFZ98_11380 [Vicinamibacterales bacterium]